MVIFLERRYMVDGVNPNFAGFAASDLGNSFIHNRIRGYVVHRLTVFDGFQQVIGRKTAWLNTL